MNLMQQLVDVMTQIARREVAKALPVTRWATVTATSPLRVRVDGEPAPLDVTPENLAGPLTVGARVLVRFADSTLYIEGPPSL